MIWHDHSTPFLTMHHSFRSASPEKGVSPCILHFFHLVVKSMWARKCALFFDTPPACPNKKGQSEMTAALILFTQPPEHSEQDGKSACLSSYDIV